MAKKVMNFFDRALDRVQLMVFGEVICKATPEETLVTLVGMVLGTYLVIMAAIID